MTTEVQELKAGRELDALVAEKIFGATWGMEGRHLLHPRGHTLCIRLHSGALTDGSLPEYSTDIAAAWPILERLESDERRILSSVTRKQSSIALRFVWEVELRQCTRPFPLPWIAEAEGVAEAICRASLSAVTPPPEQK